MYSGSKSTKSFKNVKKIKLYYPSLGMSIASGAYLMERK